MSLIHTRSNVTHPHVPHDLSMCDMTHSYVWHGSFMCDITLSYVWHGSFICVTWLIRTCYITSFYVPYDSVIFAIWLVYMWYDAFICATWLIHTWHDSFINAMIYPYLPDFSMTLSYMGHDSFVNADERRHTCSDLTSYVPSLIKSYVPWLINMFHISFICAMPHPYVSWLLHVFAITHSYMTHMYLGTHSKASVHMRKIHAYIRTCAMTYSYVCHDSFMYDISVCADSPKKSWRTSVHTW